MVLEQLFLQEKTNNQEYQKLIIQLINSNYHCINISAATLEEAARQSSWKRDKQFEKVAEILSGGNSDAFSALKVASDFIYKLYAQPFFLADPVILLFALLDLLFQSRQRKRMLLTKLTKLVKERFALHPSRWEEIEREIHKWLARQASF